MAGIPQVIEDWLVLLKILFQMEESTVDSNIICLGWGISRTFGYWSAKKCETQEFPVSDHNLRCTIFSQTYFSWDNPR
jgi:hypothetical protein